MRPKGIIAIIVGLVTLGLIGYLYTVYSQKTIPNSPIVSGCRAQTFTIGASGNCVKDIQTMTNYMETAGLTECHFGGAQTLPISGSYDALTATQVKVIQTWANCYYEQEGLSMRVSTAGSVDNSTWNELCDYAYTSPKQSNTSTSPFTQASIAAGKDAHC